MKLIERPQFIYILYDPTFISKKFYVGYSYDPAGRLKEHINRKNENITKDEWVKELANKNIQPIFHIVTSLETIELAGIAEIKLISFLKNIGLELINKSIGGNQPPILSGEENPTSKLTQTQINNIRIEFLEEKVSRSKIAKKYSTSLTNVCDIVSYKSWKNDIELTDDLNKKVKQRIREEKDIANCPSRGIKKRK